MATQIIRDYIPAGEEPNAAERVAFARTVQGIEPGTRVKPDYIPAPGKRLATAAPREVQLARLMDPRNRDKGTAKALDDAYKLLHRSNVAQVVDYVREASPFDRDAILFVEASTQARTTILDQFPMPSEAAVAKFVSTTETSSTDENTGDEDAD